MRPIPRSDVDREPCHTTDSNHRDGSQHKHLPTLGRRPTAPTAKIRKRSHRGHLQGERKKQRKPGPRRVSPPLSAATPTPHIPQSEANTQARATRKPSLHPTGRKNSSPLCHPRPRARNHHAHGHQDCCNEFEAASERPGTERRLERPPRPQFAEGVPLEPKSQQIAENALTPETLDGTLHGAECSS